MANVIDTVAIQYLPASFRCIQKKDILEHFFLLGPLREQLKIFGMSLMKTKRPNEKFQPESNILSLLLKIGLNWLVLSLVCVIVLIYGCLKYITGIQKDNELKNENKN